ncbi:MAG TPA: bifunctional phosphoglucose/phosphomannose isomerase [Nitriliruptorales bacterium]|nr:bifunctional phosphoglucose/phosphomannose isomerase [Nitriliruptorales bacterium]
MEEARLAQLDPEGMLATVEHSSEQWAGALEIARAMPALGVGPGTVRAVVVAGMGGSGIVADIASVAAHRYGRVPVVPAKGYDLPGWVGPDSLVVLVSYSGDTEETLACLDAAATAGAHRLVVTSGGQLAGRAAEEGIVTARVPGGGQPRANLPNLVVPVLVALERAGFLEGVEEQLAGVSRHLRPLVERWRHGRADGNDVTDLAESLHGLVPVFYGSVGWLAVAALRAKSQVNENAKRPAFWHELPELDHNEIVGWGALPEVCRRYGIVELRSAADEHTQVARRFTVTGEVVGDRVALWRSATFDGPTPLARFAAAVLFVDLLSVHLAFLEQQDPTPVEAISLLKRRLAEPPPGGDAPGP